MGSPLFFTSQDGTNLRMVRHGPDLADPGRDLLVVHGLAEHAGRYEHVAAAFVARGWRVSVLELRGHGASGGKRGHVARWDEYVQDLVAGSRAISPDFALLAHSMGGLVSLDAVRAGLRPRRVALSNPLLGVRVPAPYLKEKAARLLSSLWPSLSLTNELDPGMLSRDKTVGEVYARDPLVYNTITPRWYTEMRGAIARVSSADFDVPLRFFLSETDPITDPPASRALAGRNPSMSVQEYPGMLHELFNEIGQEQVISDVAAYLEA